MTRMVKTKKRGRPTARQPKRNLTIRCTLAQRRRWERAAKGNLSEWIRRQLDEQAAGR